MKKFSLLKQRIRQFADNENISISEIYSKSGISDGTLSNASGLNEESLLKIFSAFPGLDANWVIRGDHAAKSEKSNSVDKLKNKYIALLEENSGLQKENAALKERLLKLGDTPKATSTRRHSA